MKLKYYFTERNAKLRFAVRQSVHAVSQQESEQKNNKLKRRAKMKFNWVTFKVKDMEKSLAFYTELLGINVAAKFGSPDHRIAMLGEADGTKIELLFDPNSGEITPGNGASIGLEFDDLDKLVSVLKAKGYAVSGPMSPNPELKFFFVEDPDGYTIQLVGTQNK